jgi:hypothetical protein
MRYPELEGEGMIIAVPIVEPCIPCLGISYYSALEENDTHITEAQSSSSSCAFFSIDTSSD